MESRYPAGKYQLYVDTGFAGASHEQLIEVPSYFGLTEQEWEELSDDDKEEMLDDIVEAFMQDEIEYGCCRVGS